MPILITAGSTSPSGPFTLSGPDFRFSSVSDARFEPLSTCGGGCAPGTGVSLDLFEYSLFNGTATYQGKTYITGPGPAGHSLISAGFTGSLTLPEISGPDITLIQAVDFTGSIHFLEGLGSVNLPLQLGANSVAQAFLSFTVIPNPLAGNPNARYQGPELWRYSGARYEISTVPEPPSVARM